MKIKTVRQTVGKALAAHGWNNEITYLSGVRKGKGFNFFVEKNKYAHNITIKNLDEVLKGRDKEASLTALGNNFAYNLEEQLTIQLLSEKSIDELEDNIEDEVGEHLVQGLEEEFKTSADRIETSNKEKKIKTKDKNTNTHAKKTRKRI